MFCIGYEFEVSTELEKHEVRKLLKREYPEWHKEIKIVRDYTFAGWELVSPPYTEDVAKKRLNDLLKFINSYDELTTDKHTAIHVNISFEEQTLNNRIEMDTLYANTHIDKVLKSFNRVLNTYCRSPKNYHFYEYIQFNNLDEICKFTNDESYRNKKIKELKTRFEREVKTSKKNVPIADKKCKQKRYFEFRMMGNKNYHKKIKLINKYIEHFKEALVNTVNSKV